MGDFVTFRNKGRGRVVGGGFLGTSITEPILHYKKGWLSVANGGAGDPGDGSQECGIGTTFSAPATLDQICEIYYRVRDGWFTQGAHSEANEDYAITNFDPPSKLVFYEQSFIDPVYRFYARGQFLYDKTPPFDPIPHLGVPYEFGLGSQVIYELDDELGKWDNNFGISPGRSRYPYSGLEHEIATTSFSDDDFNPWFPSSFYALDRVDDNGENTFSDNRLQVRFDNRVLWVGGDHPFSPDSVLYPRVMFRVAGLNSQDGSLSYPLGIDFVIKLSNTAVHIPLYGDSAGFTGTANYVLEAKKWWPYADQAGNPVYDETTGLPL